MNSTGSITADAWRAWIASVRVKHEGAQLPIADDSRPGQQKQKEVLMRPHPRKTDECTPQFPYRNGDGTRYVSSALKAQEKKVDGGLAAIEDKKIPEPP